MAKILLICAMHLEIPSFLKNGGAFTVWEGHEIRILKTGIGFKNASRSTGSFLSSNPDYLPDLVINFGLCGGVQKGLQVGDVIVADQICYQGVIITPIIPDHLFAERKADFKKGMIETTKYPRFSSKSLSPEICGVEMEAFAIADVILKRSLPLAVVKIVSDIVPQFMTPFTMLKQLKALLIQRKRLKGRIDQLASEFIKIITIPCN